MAYHPSNPVTSRAPEFRYCGLHKSWWNKFVTIHHWSPIPVAARSKVWVCGRSLPGIARSNPARWMDVSFEWRMLTSRGISDGSISRREGVLLSVIRGNSNPLCLQWVLRSYWRKSLIIISATTQSTAQCFGKIPTNFLPSFFLSLAFNLLILGIVG
jgi:hypothetical protein